MTDRPSSLAGTAERRAPGASRVVDAVTSNRSLLVALAAILVMAVVFGLFPDLDLAAARLFYTGDGHFVGQGTAGHALRRVFYGAPFAILGLMLVLFLAGRAGRAAPWAPGGRGIAFLALSLALGPGLLVNTILKDHSHRPRPAQVAEFGGPSEFRPFYALDGTCERNCSFVSGEGSAAFWTVGPALLAPASMQPGALAGALVFGVSVSLLRMAFGGHFLSDTIFAALFTWLVLIATWRICFAAGRERPPR